MDVSPSEAYFSLEVEAAVVSCAFSAPDEGRCN